MLYSFLTYSGRDGNKKNVEDNLLLYHKYLCPLKKKDVILGEGESTEVWAKGPLCARQTVHHWAKHPHYQEYLKMGGNYFNSNRSNYTRYCIQMLRNVYQLQSWEDLQWDWHVNGDDSQTP